MVTPPSPPYDFIFLASMTLALGFLLKRMFHFRTPKGKLAALYPFALVYLPVSLVFAFYFNDLPVKLYPISVEPFNSQKASGPGPQGFPNAESLIVAIMFWPSVVVNVALWLLSLYIIIRYWLTKRTVANVASQ